MRTPEEARNVQLMFAALRRTFTALDAADMGTPFERFAAERITIKTKGSPPRLVKLAFNPVQRHYLAQKAAAVGAGKKPWYLVLKYRQGGITTCEQAHSYWLSVTRRNQRIMTLAQTDPKTREIFEMVELMYRSDGTAPEREGTGKSKTLLYPTLNSVFLLSTAGSKAGGRGGTYQKVHWSEVAHSCTGPGKIGKQRELLTGLMDATENGELVLETTANGSELFREKYIEAKHGGNSFTAIFLPWFIDPTNTDPVAPDEAEQILSSLSSREADLVRMHRLSSSQIKWRRRKVADLGPLFAQEHPEDDESCFLVTGSSYFPVARVLALLEALPDPFPGATVRELPGGGIETIWAAPEPGQTYSAGADTSEGVAGSDPNGVGIINDSTGEQVADIHGCFTPRELADHAVRLCRRYNDALLGVERNNHGHAVLQKVQDLGYVREGIELYYERGSAGWVTDPVSRPVLINDLSNACFPLDGERGMTVRDRGLLREMLTFNRQSAGKYAADAGSHDDRVMKWAIAWQMRKQPRMRAARWIGGGE